MFYLLKQNHSSPLWSEPFLLGLVYRKWLICITANFLVKTAKFWLLIWQTQLKFVQDVQLNISWVFFYGYKEWSSKFATGLNVRIGIDKKMYEWPDYSFAKMVYSLRKHFGKRTAWSHYKFQEIKKDCRFVLYTLLGHSLNFLNYAYYDI